MNFRKTITGICLAALMIPSCALAAAADTPVVTDVAYHQNFFSNVSDLAGFNGIDISEYVDWEDRGIALGFDENGDSIQAVDEQDLRYFDGKYYLYGESFLYGTFNHAIAVQKDPVMTNTDPDSFHRYCGMNIYSSEDLMNWTLEETVFMRNEETGWIYTMKKPRVIYSEKTGMYNLWFLNAHTTGSGMGTYGVCQSTSPTGPWSQPFEPIIEQEGAELGPDYEIVEGPDGDAYLVCSHNGLRVSKMNDERTGIVNQITVPEFDKSAMETLAGGIGLHWHKNAETGKIWWYMTGSIRCGNCVGSPLMYIMAEDPMGPWLSPETKSADVPLTAASVNDLCMYSQVHSSVMLPDVNGEMQTIIPATHYYSSNIKNQTAGIGWQGGGESSEAISGLFLFTLEYNEDGTIKEIPYFDDVAELPLAKTVETTIPKNYMPYTNITKDSTVTQSWMLEPNETVACILPSVFQRATQPVIEGADYATYAPIVPFVNAPLHAEVTLPDGTVYEWDIDARTVVWAPTRTPLNLPEAFTAGDEGGMVTLTLSTTADNGKYGVAVGYKSDLLPEGQYITTDTNGERLWPDAEILVKTSTEKCGAPVITKQPESLTVVEGSMPGFWVEAEGVGLGYQWRKDGEIILAPTGWNESASPSFRLGSVTVEDSGVYTVEVFNNEGSVMSQEVTLTVIPAATAGE